MPVLYDVFHHRWRKWYSILIHRYIRKVKGEGWVRFRTILHGRQAFNQKAITATKINRQMELVLYKKVVTYLNNFIAGSLQTTVRSDPPSKLVQESFGDSRHNTGSINNHCYRNSRHYGPLQTDATCSVRVLGDPDLHAWGLLVPALWDA